MELNGLLYSLPWIALMLYALYRIFPTASKTQLTVLFLVKVIFTFALQWIYTYHFTDRSTADIYRFFDDGIILRNIAFEDPVLFLKITIGLNGGTEAQIIFEQMNAWIKPFDSGFYNDNHIMIKLNAFMAFVSFGYYELHGLFFSFGAFAGLLLLVQTLLPKEEWSLSNMLVVLFPSSLLWLSGGLKESLLILGLGLTITGFISKHNALGRRLTLILIGGFILSSVKLYFGLALIPALVIAEAASRRGLNWIVQTAAWLALAIISYLALDILGFDTVEYVVRKQHEFLNHSEEILPGSAFTMPYLEEDILSLLFYAPLALMNSLIRPFIWEFDGPAEGLMMLESLDVLFVLGVILYFSFKDKKTSQRLYWLFLLITPLAILIGTTTPIFGAIMRYRAPLLVLLFIYASPYIRRLISRDHSI